MFKVNPNREHVLDRIIILHPGKEEKAKSSVQKIYLVPWKRKKSKIQCTGYYIESEELLHEI